MAYRFKLSAKVGLGFRRIAREQIEIAARELTAAHASGQSVHGGRKALKRLRALIRAAAPALGNRAALKHDRAIRDISRMVSGRRDAEVLLHTIGKLEAHLGAEAVTACAPLRRALVSAQSATPDAADGPGIDTIRLRLEKAGEQLRTAKLKDMKIEHILAGVEETYRIGRKAARAAYRKPADERFHDLRKDVQAHWRHMALLSRAWPEAFGARANAARELSQLLGDDHDLAMLKAATRGLTENERLAAVELCERMQRDLRAAVKYRAERLYAERAPAFGARMSVYWTSALQIKVHELKGQGLPEDQEAAATAVGSAPSIAAKTPATPPSQRRA